MRDLGVRDVILVELDFGALPVREGKFAVNDTRVTATSNVLMLQSGQAPTGKSADENELDAIDCRCTPAPGQFTAYLSSLFGPVSGKFKFGYVLR